MPDKTCPKCSKEMRPSTYLGIIPAVKQTLTGDAMSDRGGAQVAMWVCSGCNYVELYYRPNN